MLTIVSEDQLKATSQLEWFYGNGPRITTILIWLKESELIESGHAFICFTESMTSQLSDTERTRGYPLYIS